MFAFLSFPESTSSGLLSPRSIFPQSLLKKRFRHGGSTTTVSHSPLSPYYILTAAGLCFLLYNHITKRSSSAGNHPLYCTGTASHLSFVTCIVSLVLSIGLDGCLLACFSKSLRAGQGGRACTSALLFRLKQKNTRTKHAHDCWLLVMASIQSTRPRKHAPVTEWQYFPTII